MHQYTYTTHATAGVEEERAPASVFRYYFYEKWASAYNQDSLIMLAGEREGNHLKINL